MELLVSNSDNGNTLSPEHELAQDLLVIVTAFGARLHGLLGLRSYQKVIRDVALRKDSAPGQ